MSVVIGCFGGDQPRRKFGAHAVVRSRKVVLGCWVGRLRPFVCTRRGEGIYTLLWATSRLICTTALSFWVKLLALQFFHIHICIVQQETWTDLHPSCVAETTLYLWLTFSGTVIFWFWKSYQFKHIETSRESVCVFVKLIILSVQ